MATAIAAVAPTVNAPPPRAAPKDAPMLHRRFTVAEYYRMGEAGIFAEGERVELIDGEILKISPISLRHARAVDRANRCFTRRAPENVIVRVQNPIYLDGHSEPEPDLAVVTEHSALRATHPTPSDVLLVIEIAESSASSDRAIKLPLYANFGIREVWLLNLRGEPRPDRADTEVSPEPVLEVYRKPGPIGYAEIRLLRPGERITPEALPDLEVSVNELLPEEFVPVEPATKDDAKA